MSEDIVDRLRVPWEKMERAGAYKVTQMQKERFEAADEIELLRAAVCDAESKLEAERMLR